jgi:hypothetical protein
MIRYHEVLDQKKIIANHVNYKLKITYLIYYEIN